MAGWGCVSLVVGVGGEDGVQNTQSGTDPPRASWFECQMPSGKDYSSHLVHRSPNDETGRLSCMRHRQDSQVRAHAAGALRWFGTPEQVRPVDGVSYGSPLLPP